MKKKAGRILKSLRLPGAELALGSGLSIYGRDCLLAEGCRAVKEFSESRLVLELEEGGVCIWGEELCLRTMIGGALLLKGRLGSIEWED